ncbi:MAG: hypothetical protein ACI4LP_05910 [Anaerovoracaceae bacterium]
MKIKDIAGNIKVMIFRGTNCVWDSSFDDLESLSDLGDETIEAVEVYLAE